MGKFVNLLILLLTLTGCAGVQIPNYIPADHPYVRKISGNYNDILDAIKVVLFKDGYNIQSRLNPSVYERRSDGGDQSKDVLLFTDIKAHSRLVYSTYTHMNIFIHPIAEGAEVDVRISATTPLGIKQLQATRHDKLAKKFLNQVEQELESK